MIVVVKQRWVGYCCFVLWNCHYISLRVRRSRGERYSGHGRLCVCVCLSLAAFPHYCTDPDVSCRNGRGCPLVVHYWADLQSMHGFRCYDNIARTRNVSECLYSLCAWLFYHSCSTSHIINVSNINYFWLVKFSFHLLKLPMFKYVHVFAIRLVVK